MTPQARGVVPPETVARIAEARAVATDADWLVKQITVQALVDGGSYPELSKATGIATSTLQRWVREVGASPAGRVDPDDYEARTALFMQRIRAMRDAGLL